MNWIRNVVLRMDRRTSGASARLPVNRPTVYRVDASESCTGARDRGIGKTTPESSCNVAAGA
jgi:hypothetical protein